ncbi:Zinc finger BED domain-containing protein 4 [Araneus ventricosus]|uniref:Zinc finger BED domain-containing protein 4 n=1 Tax=Araneus ventricosus TaxID=182803 RepID=A0A4Y2TJP4_ARAVE|nr:Zinc finger BED domain-containing protein 4 [Araneus ventricosus]GBO00819.1 Zinc finger BED domain-containing protein 4 [Araneus ventricosus]
MKDHLKRKHPDIIVKYTEDHCAESMDEAGPSNIPKKRRDSVKEFIGRSLFYEETSSRKKYLDKLFALMISLDMEPLRMGEHEGLKNFVHALDPKYVLPDTSTLTNKLLPQMYNEVRSKLLTALKDCDNLSITVDTWTTIANEAILAVTGHFMYCNKLISPLLAALKVEGSQNAGKIATVIHETLEGMDCRKKVVTIVTDNLQSMINAAEILKIKHLPCFAHTLNLVMTDAFKITEFEILINKCKKIVSFFKHSTLASDTLKSIQKECNKKQLKLVQQVDTRWNSTFYMLERIRVIRNELTLAISKCEKAPPNLSAEEYKMIEEIEKMLEPFEVATNLVSGEEYPSLSIILPIIKGLSLKLVELEKINLNEISRKLLESLKNSVSKRIKPYEKRTSCIMATLLNPKYKKRGFKTDDEAENAIRLLQNEYTSFLSTPDKIQNSEPPATASSSKKEKVDDLLYFLNIPDSQYNPRSDAIVDVRQYVEKPNIFKAEDPLKYWQVSQSKLKELAFKYLSIPASSTPAERIFSLAGQILTERRNRLDSEHFHHLLFIKQNFKLFN